ncbi:hypothetical protein AHAS_Ahas13G0319700 [Arachis hypogaea]
MYIVFLVKFCHVFLVGFHEAVYTFPLLLHIIFLHLRVISGCYNIKTGPGCSIELMKFDMGGSSAVLGVTKALGQIKPLGVERSIKYTSISQSQKYNYKTYSWGVVATRTKRGAAGGNPGIERRQVLVILLYRRF